MHKHLIPSLFLAVCLSACAPGAVPPATVAAATTAAPVPVATTAVPAQPQPQDCGYQWGYEDLPELTSSFQHSIQALQPEAEASAYAFGENCIRADGTIGNFSAMETDFNITLHVDDLANEAVLGRWVIQVMDVIQQIPPEQIQGPRPGRVSIVFQSSTAQEVINFYIDQYQALPAGLSHTEVHETLKTPQ